MLGDGHHGRMILFVPRDQLRPRRVDDHFAAEADAAREAEWTVALVDHDSLQHPDRADPPVTQTPAGGHALYRGWMLRSEQYIAFAQALAHRDIALRQPRPVSASPRTSVGPCLAGLTQHRWTVGAAGSLQPSRLRLADRPYCATSQVDETPLAWGGLHPDLSDADAAWAMAAGEMREDEFTGGYVLRQFETFTGPEVRTWWINGACRLITAHPDTPDNPPPAEIDLDPIARAVNALRLPFVTVDLAHRTDGVWRHRTRRSQSATARAPPHRATHRPPPPTRTDLDVMTGSNRAASSLAGSRSAQCDYRGTAVSAVASARPPLPMSMPSSSKTMVRPFLRANGRTCVRRRSVRVDPARTSWPCHGRTRCSLAAPHRAGSP